MDVTETGSRAPDEWTVAPVNQIERQLRMEITDIVSKLRSKYLGQPALGGTAERIRASMTQQLIAIGWVRPDPRAILVDLSDDAITGTLNIHFDFRPEHFNFDARRSPNGLDVMLEMIE